MWRDGCERIDVTALTDGRAALGPERGVGRLPGLALSALLGLLAIGLADAPGVRALGLGGLSLAIVLGMLAGNTFHAGIAQWTGAGVACARGALLRLGIVLYGLRLTLQDLAQVGVAGVLVDVMIVGGTFALALWIGVRWLGLDRRTTMLIGAGSSICGAAAVLATEPVVRGRPEQVTVAVSTVVVFGTLATFLYPALHALNQAWPFIPGGARGFGVYIGSTVHEVGQVVAAGEAVGAQAADAAVIAKMVRVMLLAPFLLVLSAWLLRHPGAARRLAGRDGGRVAMPWFALAFVAVVLLNSLHWLLPATKATAVALGDLLLAMAMAALGLTTRVAAIRAAGARPLLLALLLFGWLVVGGALLNRWALGWLG